LTVPRIYAEQALSVGATLELDPAASRHVSGALRLQPGAELILFNGHGGEYRAVIAASDRKRVAVTVTEQLPREVESPLQVHLGIVMSRGERMDWVIQKSTELGVHAITPLTSERCEVRLKPDRAEKKRLHWRQIARSACEQCGRNQVPEIGPITALEDWVRGCDSDIRLVLHHRSEATDLPAAAPSTAALLIGPEGGLSPTEIQSSQKYDFAPLALGPRVLRTETAPIAALAILQARWGDML
jgi:16S rRNA (uracil1498-N3)-methyltransferase